MLAIELLGLVAQQRRFEVGLQERSLRGQGDGLVGGHGVSGVLISFPLVGSRDRGGRQAREGQQTDV